MTRIYHMRPAATGAVVLQSKIGAHRYARAHGAKLVRALRAKVRAATGKAPTHAYLYYATHMTGAAPVWAEQGGVKVYA